VSESTDTIRQATDARKRDGTVTSLEYFWDHAEALKAVGLEE